MANYASKHLKLELADSGDVLRDISSFVRSFNGIDIESMTQEGHAFLDTWVTNLFTGMSKVNAMTLEGFYNDAANTPVSLYARGASRRFQITWDAGGGPAARVTLLTVLMQKFTRTPVLGELTKFSLTLLPASSVTTDS